jgi:hypothetical protein
MPLEKLGEVFVPHPVLTKNLSRIFKIRLRLLRIGLEDDVVK